MRPKPVEGCWPTERGCFILNGKNIGIISDGPRGEAIAYQFAANGYNAKVYEIDPENREKRVNASRDQLKIRFKRVKGGYTYLPVEDRPVSWVGEMMELADCELFIEGLEDDNFEAKNESILKLRELAGQSAPILSNTIRFLPSQLSARMSDNANFAVAYFLDIEYTGNTVELVAHKNTAPEILEKARSILKGAKFAAFAINECPGFIHNRVGGLGIVNLFRMYDEKILSYREMGKYLIVTKVSPASLITLSMENEIKTELITLIEVFKAMNRHYGDRFYAPGFLREKALTLDNISEKIAAASRGDSTDEEAPAAPSGERELNNIYISGVQRIHSNIISSLIRKGKKLYIDSRKHLFVASMEKDNPSLYSKLIANAGFIDEVGFGRIDLAMDFNVEAPERKIARVRELQIRLGKDIPILLNTPMYKLEDIASGAENPSMIFGMYTIKNYLSNTELVITPRMDKAVYIQLKGFFNDLCGGCIETRDAHVRPLIFMLIPKMLDSVRLLEERVAGREEIELLGVDGPIFKYMDLFGLDLIVLISDYLAPYYGEVFRVPQMLRDMARNNERFY